MEIVDNNVAGEVWDFSWLVYSKWWCMVVLTKK